ncbi:Farnesyl pyrophosphate synthase [Hondaea fermentalgiana]|uniref:Farnesyl pyrophosphate synthase n=1 Tax=Hondaea fermentalgiana TaxID=2315210 RepID=A0A2R5GEF0_9STRA|nr:Farnesyl pyrophosphate synthase [Hondaea fermentalgiana]|eukprot:GBG28108.1 Farnesyl pyrophosphate synthase [Hondaea fermentalgiana]
MTQGEGSNAQVALTAVAAVAAVAGIFGAGVLLGKKSKAISGSGEGPVVLQGGKGVAKAGTFDAAKKPGFIDVFKGLAEELCGDLSEYELTELISKPMQRMLDYNVPGGKLNRGLTVVHAALEIAKFQGKSSTKDEETIRAQSAVLGWCIEWLQASFLVSDDLMDSSITRRGQPCWYKNEDVGFIAVNDALILMTQVDVLLYKMFADEDPDLFLHVHRIMTETTYQTEMGQFLDLSTQPPQGPINLDLYTSERHYKIVKYKTAFYSFYAPIAFGMAVAGVRDKESLDVACDICVKMGVYFQVQDDYLDCYGEPEVIGKIGTDIQDGKCSWLVTQALTRASAEQKEVLKANYAKDDEECIKTVKGIYNELKLADIYHEYEESIYKEICSDIEAKVTTVPKEIFYALLHKIYKRSK